MTPSDTETVSPDDDAFFDKAYDELPGLAHAKMSKEYVYFTIQGTALVHEAWLRLGGQALHPDRLGAQAEKPLSPGVR